MQASTAILGNYNPKRLVPGKILDIRVVVSLLKVADDFQLPDRWKMSEKFQGVV